MTNCKRTRAPPTGRQIRNCVMTHSPTTDIISVAITQSSQFTPAIAHIVECSQTHMISGANCSIKFIF
jgi:hypothetical protein